MSTGSAESPSTLRDSPKPADKSDIQKPADRKNSTQEERKRGQRLFGGLLSALSQSSAGTQQKRRQDIEKQQQERAKRQKLEDEGRQQEKLQILKELRTQDMVVFEEESVSYLEKGAMFVDADRRLDAIETRQYPCNCSLLAD